MAILVFVLSLALLVAGLAGAYMSLDLLPTGPGLLYALGGAVAACAAILTFALGVVIRRIDALSKLLRRQGAEAVAVERSPPLDAELSGEQTADAQAQEMGEPAAGPAPINENRAGHLPTLDETENAVETPEAPPSLIGRYSSGGANYLIFADGSIEAETLEGSFKFASMGDFKQYLAQRKDGNR